MRIILALLFLLSFISTTAFGLQSSFSFSGNVTGAGPTPNIQLTIYSGACNLYSQSYAAVPLDGSGNFSVNIDGTGTFLNGTYVSLSQIFDTKNTNITGQGACTINGTLLATTWAITVSVNSNVLTGFVPINAVPFAISAQNAEKIGGQNVSTTAPVPNDVLQFSGGNWNPVAVSSLGMLSAGSVAGGDLSGTYPNPTLAATSVTPGPYGSTTQVATFTVDAKGRLTAAGSTLISGVTPGGAAGGDLAGTYPNPTLAAIIGSGTQGSSSAVPSITYDTKGRITAISSSPYVDATGVTKGIVQVGSNISLASGVISVSSGNVTSALGYTPVNKAGDTMAGNLTMQTNAGVILNNTANTFGVIVKAPAALGSNLNLVLPANNGVSTNVLSTDGAGNLSWATANLGTVTSVSTGVGLIGGPITGTGTIGLGTELAGLNSLGTTGFMKRLGGGSYSTLGSVNLAADVSGTLPVANGGTNTSSAPTAAGQLLIAQGLTSYAPVAMTGDAAITSAGVITIGVSRITSSNIVDGTIVDADINGTAAIADTKLGTISTPGKVSGSAITSGTISGTTAVNTTGTITSGAITSPSLSSASFLSLTAALNQNLTLTTTGTGSVVLNGNRTIASSAGGDMGLFVPSANSMIFQTNSTERVRIDSIGNIGIGNSSPAANVKLNLNVPTLAFAVPAELGISTTGLGRRGLAIQGVAGQTANLQEWQNNGGTVLASVNPNGNIDTGGSLSATNGYFVKACPVNYTLVNIGRSSFCFRTSSPGTANFLGAILNCATENAKLCTLQQYSVSCNLLSSGYQNTGMNHWTDQVYNTADAITSNATSCNPLSSMAIGNYPFGTFLNYRCCIEN